MRKLGQIKFFITDPVAGFSHFPGYLGFLPLPCQKTYWIIMVRNGQELQLSQKLTMTLLLWVRLYQKEEDNNMDLLFAMSCDSCWRDCRAMPKDQSKCIGARVSKGVVGGKLRLAHACGRRHLHQTCEVPDLLQTPKLRKIRSSSKVIFGVSPK